LVADPPPRDAFATPGDALPRPHDNCYWLLPGLVLAGEYPASRDPARPEMTQTRITALLDAGVREFVDLTSAAEALPPYSEAIDQAAARLEVEVIHQRWAIADYSVPDPALMRQILSRLHQAIAAKRPVYLHCQGGIGRTGTVAGCLLVECGFSGAEALGLIDAKWQVMAKRERAPQSPETAQQREFVLSWAAKIGLDIESDSKSSSN
jgi:protein-tyrosine phosphatase